MGSMITDIEGSFGNWIGMGRKSAVNKGLFLAALGRDAENSICHCDLYIRESFFFTFRIHLFDVPLRLRLLTLPWLGRIFELCGHLTLSAMRVPRSIIDNDRC